MNTSTRTIGFGITGSFCTFHSVLPVLESLVQKGYRVLPILSNSSASFDTRFTTADAFVSKVESITQNKCIRSIVDAEPIGPKALLDALVIAPCTGNTIAKLTAGITDSPVLMAAKAHLRNQRPLLLSVSTNDGLGMNLKNIGTLLNTKYIYFVPFGQDDCVRKSNSLVADFSLIPDALEAAFHHQQMQPILLR